MSGFTEVADRVWTYAGLAGTHTLVVGSTGAALLSPATDAQALSAATTLSGESAPVMVLLSAPAAGDLDAIPEAVEIVVHEDGVGEQEPAVRTFSSALARDLGDRFVELFHPGTGASAADVVARIADPDVLVTGPLVDQTTGQDGAQAHPRYGPQCFPMGWPVALELVTVLAQPGTLVIPGSGAAAGRQLVEDNQDVTRAVAETIRELAGRGVPLDRALVEGSWPLPAEELTHAVRRGYEQLPPGARALPLLG